MQALPRIEWIGPLAPRALGAEQAARAAEALRTAPPPRPMPRVRAIPALFLLSFLTLGLHAVPGIGSLHTRTVVAAGTETPPIGAGDPEMQRMRSLAAGVVGVGVMASGASAQQAVQWRVEDGGNGHWYLPTTEAFAHFQTANSFAQTIGGHLVTLTTPAENSFVASIAEGDFILGGYQDRASANFAEPNAGWRWVTNEPWSFTSWNPGEPNNGGWPDERGEHYLVWWRFGGQSSGDTWNDAGNDMTVPPWNAPWNLRAIVEFDSDCNSDGIVDYGQILSGQLADVNQNGVPDICEAQPCPGDITGNGVVDGVDLSIVLATWLTDGDQGKVNSDRNGDGIVNGLDLAIVLVGWGACP